MRYMYLLTGPSPFYHTSLYKLLEKIMYSRLYSYIEKKHTLYRHQHGFPSGHSTALPLLRLHDDISADVGQGAYCLRRVVEETQDQDIVNHDLLLLKLRNMAIRGVAQT